MTALIAANPLPYAGSLVASSEPDRAAAAIFRMRSADMAERYQAAFSALAAEYRITIVAGSIVLAGAHVEDGAIRTRPGGPLENVSAVFGPDGGVHAALVRKAYPIPSEAGFTAGASLEDYPVFDTPTGRLGVLICADSWHPDVYAALGQQICWLCPPSCSRAGCGTSHRADMSRRGPMMYRGRMRAALQRAKHGRRMRSRAGYSTPPRAPGSRRFSAVRSGIWDRMARP